MGFVAPDIAVQLKPIGNGFVNLIKMLISPIIFCTIVLGVGSVRKAAKVGTVGGLALGYFMVMSTTRSPSAWSSAICWTPARGCSSPRASRTPARGQAEGASEGAARVPARHHPHHLVSAFTSGEVLQTLLVALLVGLRACRRMGTAGEPVLRGIGHLQRLVFRVLAMIMWAAPVGAFGAIAAVVGETGLDALKAWRSSWSAST